MATQFVANVPDWYAAFADAIASGEPYFLECGDCGAAFLPPRRICPDCGGTSPSERPLSDTATVATFTEISVTTPKFHGETPYTVVLAAFEEGVRLTGQLRGAETVSIGQPVALGVEGYEDGSDVVTFEPVDGDG